MVLRVEVEAVKFLKEEPHRLDALLKRCKTITDTLTAMRKYEPSPAESYTVSLLFCLCSPLKEFTIETKLNHFHRLPLQFADISGLFN